MIIDLYHLKNFEPVILVGILNGIRREVDLLNGELKLCSIGRLGTLKVKEIYPEHGNISKHPEEDMHKAILNAEKLLCDNTGVEIAREIRSS